MPPRVVQVLLAVAATLVAVEGGLQALAWLRSGAPSDPVGDAVGAGPTVLCVGDSLTFGLGAERTAAWPTRLAAALTAEFPGVRVVNDALPGQTSVDVLERLAPRLDELQPDVVCLLFGWNDTWSRPPPLEALPSGRTAFRWRWRTWRLLQLAFAGDPKPTGGFPDAALAESTPIFLGAWHVGAADFAFFADGRASFGGLEVSWSETAHGVRIVHDDPAVTPYEIRIRRRADGRLEFQHPRWSQYMLARPGLAADRTPVDIAADLCDADQPDLARATLRTARDGPHRAAAAAALLPLSDDDAERVGLVAELRQVWSAPDAPAAVGEALALEAFRVGHREAGFELGLETVARDPLRVATWAAMLDRAHGDLERTAELAARLAKITGSSRAPAELATCALLAARIAPDAAGFVTHLANAVAHGVGISEATEAFRAAVARDLDPAALAAALDSADLDSADLDSADLDSADFDRAAVVGLRTAFRRATADRDEVGRVLGQHLELAIDACRARGADVVLLGYPFAFAEHEAVTARVAAQRGVPRVELRESFDAILRTAPRSDWFVDAIHCTALGYAEMARLVTPVVAAVLRER